MQNIIRSIHLSLDVQSWSYDRKLRFEGDLLHDARRISFSCRRRSSDKDFTVNGRRWSSEIEVMLSIGEPFDLDPPEADLGLTVHAKAVGDLIYNPNNKDAGFSEFLLANILVSENLFSELFTCRENVQIIQFRAVGKGATVDNDSAPRWNNETKSDMYLSIYEFGFYLAPNSLKAG